MLHTLGTSRRGVDGVDAPALESLAQEIQAGNAIEHQKFQTSSQ
jgi:hypothetical protein